MLVLQSHHRLFFCSAFAFSLPYRRQTHALSLFRAPATLSTLSALSQSRSEPVSGLAVEISDATDVVEEDGPIELAPSYPSLFSSPSSIFATSDDPTPIQVSTSVLLTGAITVFLFRSIRRRAKRAKELKFRSSGAKKSLKEEAMENLKTMRSAPIESKSSPSAAEAFLGAIAAGVIALILYKFTATVEAALNRQTVSDNFSVRQITITVRTIVNGLCYLATFVFGINSVGLFLYSCQLAINSFMGDSGNDGKAAESRDSANPSNNEVNNSSEDQTSGD